MSKMTLRKRIALVAVSTLGAGMLSIVSASTAQATAGSANSATEVTSAKLQLATMASTSGSVTVSATADGSANRSTGLVYESNGPASGTSVTGGTTQTAVMTSNGSLVFYTGTAANSLGAFVAEGGTFSSFTSHASATTLSVNAGRTVAFLDGATTYAAVAFTPSSGTTSAVVYLYTGTGTSASIPTNGTLRGRYTISVVAPTATGSGAYSAAYSTIAFDDADITAPQSQTDSVDDGTYIANAGVGYVGVNLTDAYGLTLGAGVLQATATNGVVCAWESNPTALSVSTAIYTTASYGTLHCSQGATNKNKSVTSVVTFSYNGTVVGTKTILWHGTAAKINVYDAVISDLGSPTTATAAIPNGAKFKVLDAAGNWINEETAVAVDGASYDLAVVSSGTVATSSDPDTPQVGYLNWTCSATKGGTGKFTVFTYDAALTKISTVVSARCGGDIDTFKVSTDKAAYTPGEIITVTISGFDENGDIANDRHAMTPVNVVASGAFASTVDTPATTDVLLNGKKTYRFIATQTEGTYSISASVPVNGSGQSATTASVTVKGATAAVSNADVLKSIVALIASINKQIQALQKLILKR